VLEDITFDVPKGRITAILGPSGTGKSVLLKNILGLLRPERGEIWGDGTRSLACASGACTRCARNSASCSKTAPLSVP